MATTPLGQPGIATPRALDARAYQQAIDSIKERFRRLERETVALRALAEANPSIKAVQSLQQQMAALARQVTALDTSASIAVINALMAQPDGLVVLKGGDLITRVLQAGEGIVILYPDGSVSAPLIKLAALTPGALLAGDAEWRWADEAVESMEAAW